MEIDILKVAAREIVMTTIRNRHPAWLASLGEVYDTDVVEGLVVTAEKAPPEGREAFVDVLGEAFKAVEDRYRARGVRCVTAISRIKSASLVAGR